MFDTYNTSNKNADVGEALLCWNIVFVLLLLFFY